VTHYKVVSAMIDICGYQVELPALIERKASSWAHNPDIF
jgi:hypothetical protein